MQTFREVVYFFTSLKYNKDLVLLAGYGPSKHILWNVLLLSNLSRNLHNYELQFTMEALYGYVKLYQTHSGGLLILFTFRRLSIYLC